MALAKTSFEHWSGSMPIRQRTGWSAWTFDDLSYENLKNYPESSGSSAAKKASQKAGATREDLVKAARVRLTPQPRRLEALLNASATSYLAQATATAKQSAFGHMERQRGQVVP